MKVSQVVWTFGGPNMFHPLKIIDNESEVSCGKKIGRYVKTIVAE